MFKLLKKNYDFLNGEACFCAPADYVQPLRDKLRSLKFALRYTLRGIDVGAQ